MRVRTDLAIIVVLWGAMAWFTWETLGYPPVARLVPLAVAVPTFLVITVQVGRDLRQAMTARSSSSVQADAAGPADRTGTDLTDDGGSVRSAEGAAATEVATSASTRGASIPTALTWLAIGAIVYLSLGLYLGMLVYMVMFLRLQGREPWPIVGAVTAGTLLTLWGLFDEFLNVAVHDGLLF